jgi:hypothetical protein
MSFESIGGLLDHFLDDAKRLLFYHLTGAFLVLVGILFVMRVKVSPGPGGQ